jgi:hypothetical protein
MPIRYMVEAVRPIKLDHISMTYIYKVFEYLLLLWIGICTWMHPSTLTIADVHPQCCRVDWKLRWLRHANNANMLWLRLRLLDLSNWITHPFHTYTRCLSTFFYCWYAFIWMHPHTLAIANIDPQCCRVDWNLRWRLRRANNANTLYDWGCKAYQTGSHIHGIHIQGVWAPSAVLDWHMDRCSLTVVTTSYQLS